MPRDLPNQPPQNPDDIDIPLDDKDIIEDKPGKVLPFPKKAEKIEHTGDFEKARNALARIWSLIRESDINTEAETYSKETTAAIRKEIQERGKEFNDAAKRLSDAERKDLHELQRTYVGLNEVDSSHGFARHTMLQMLGADEIYGDPRDVEAKTKHEDAEVIKDSEKELSAIAQEATELRKELSIVLIAAHSEEKRRPGFFKKLFANKKEKAAEKQRRLFEERRHDLIMSGGGLDKAANEMVERYRELEDRWKTVVSGLPEAQRAQYDDQWNAIEAMQQKELDLYGLALQAPELPAEPEQKALPPVPEAPESAETEAGFQERSVDFLERLLKEGANPSYVAQGLAGLDSEKAWKLRKRLLGSGQKSADLGFVVLGLAGLDSEKAWKLRKRLLKKDRGGLVASSLAGLDSEEAWQMRERLLREKGGSHMSYVSAMGDVSTSLAGLDSEKAWQMRERLLTMSGADLGDVARGLAGLDSERAWQMRELLLKKGAGPINTSIVVAESLAGLDSEKAWEMRERLYKQLMGTYSGFVARGLAGLDSERAWQMRERFVREGVHAAAIVEGLAGLDSERAWQMREGFLKEGMNKGTVALGTYDGWLMAGVRKARADRVRAGVSESRAEKEYVELNGKKFEIVNIELGGKTAEEYIAELKKQGFKIGDYDKDLLDKIELSKEKRETGTVRLTVADLGFTKATSYEDICKRANELGLELAPAEVGPALRLSMKEQPGGDWVIVAMKAVTGRGGDPSVFSLGRLGDGSWLYASHRRPGYRWDPGAAFVFVPRKQPLSA